MSNMPISLMEDSPPYLDFSTKAKEDRTESIKAGRKVYKDVEIVTITPMGDNKTQVIKEVDEWMKHLKERHHHNMISDNYLNFCERSYKAWADKQEAPISGTPIREWAQASKAEIEMILQANIRSIEDLANCNDEALQQIGMGARNLQRKAKTYLENAENSGKVSEKMAAIESQLDSANAENERMAKRLAELEAKLDAQPLIDLGTEQQEPIHI